MDKNTVIGLVVIGAMLFGFSWYNSKQSEKFQEEKRIQDSIAVAQGRRFTPEDITERDAAQAEAFMDRQAQAAAEDSVRSLYLGESLVSAMTEEEKAFRVENDLMIVTFSNKGGKITGVELKDYQKYGGGNVQMYAPNSAGFNMVFHNEKNIEIHTSEYSFATDLPPVVTFAEDQTQQHVSMKLMVDSTSWIEYLYTIHKDDYMIDFDVKFENMSTRLSSVWNSVRFDMESIGPQNEKGFQNENNYTTIAYRNASDGKKPEDLGMSTDNEQDQIDSRVQWVAFKQQFFSTIFIAENNFQNAQIGYETYAPGHANIKRFNASMDVDFDRQVSEYNFHFYYGPNRYSILKKYDIEAQRLIPLGWGIFGFINRVVVIPVFDWLEKTGMSYGLIILILTLIIKLVILPLTYKSYLSGAKMRVLKPEIDEVTAKYPKQEDAMKRQQATMELYKRAGVSPMGGCLPMLIQFPVLIAMFRFFPASIELRGESFLWADDLSSYDSILQLPFDIPFYGDHISLFTLLMAVSMHLYTRITYSQQPATNQPGMGGMKFMSLWLMPIMLLVWFNNYASGLTYYYLLSNVISMGQMLLFRGIVNEEKLHGKMKQRAAKNTKSAKKKSKWQQRYEDMMREQQRQAQQQRKK